jgi:hypothetical protein
MHAAMATLAALCFSTLCCCSERFTADADSCQAASCHLHAAAGLLVTVLSGVLLPHRCIDA